MLVVNGHFFFHLRIVLLAFRAARNLLDGHELFETETFEARAAEKLANLHYVVGHHTKDKKSSFVKIVDYELALWVHA